MRSLRSPPVAAAAILVAPLELLIVAQARIVGISLPGLRIDAGAVVVVPTPIVPVAAISAAVVAAATIAVAVAAIAIAIATVVVLDRRHLLDLDLRLLRARLLLLLDLALLVARFVMAAVAVVVVALVLIVLMAAVAVAAIVPILCPGSRRRQRRCREDHSHQCLAHRNTPSLGAAW